MTEQEKFFKTLNWVVRTCFKLVLFFVALAFVLGIMGK